MLLEDSYVEISGLVTHSLLKAFNTFVERQRKAKVAKEVQALEAWGLPPVTRKGPSQGQYLGQGLGQGRGQGQGQGLGQGQGQGQGQGLKGSR